MNVIKKYFERLYTKNKNEYYIKLSKYLDNHESKFIVTANPETFKMAKANKEIEDILLNKDNDIIPDGIAIVKAANRYGIKVKERITGIDTAVKLLELMNNKKKSLFLFGAKEEVLNDLLEKIKKEYPCIKILGSQNGYVETFDVLSGTKKRAPKLFIKMNLEWLYRIMTEPKRLKRFYENNIKFMIEVLKEKK